MANIIVEYKMDKNQEGFKVRPYWIDDGGYWYDKRNYTYIGAVSDPEVKIPETVTRLTKKSFTDRLLAIHKSKDAKGNSLAFAKDIDNDPHNRIKMTDNEVKADAEEWWDKHADS